MARRRGPPKLVALEGLLAYVARYGHQPYSDMVRLTERRLVAFGRQLERIVEQENTPKGG